MGLLAEPELRALCTSSEVLLLSASMQYSDKSLLPETPSEREMARPHLCGTLLEASMTVITVNASRML